MVWRNWPKNAGAKILSFILAAGVWVTVTNGKEFDTTLVFPVEYVPHPDGLTSIDPLPETVHVRVWGKGKFLRYTLREGVCRVDLGEYTVGRNRLVYADEDIVFPDDVANPRVDVLEPPRSVVFDETEIRDVAIMPTVVGSPDARYTIVGKTFLSPAKARVKGPRRLVDEITLLATRDINIDQRKGSIRKEVRLVAPGSPTVEVTPMVVDVGITIEPIVVERIESVALEPVINGGLPGSIVFFPATVSVEVEGARSIIEVATREVTSLPLHAQKWKPGVYRLRFEEFRERDVVLSLARRLEEPPAETPGVSEATGAGDADSTAAPAAADTVLVPQEPPPPQYEAEGIEVVGSLGVPRDVELLAFAPEELLVEVLTAEQLLARSAPPDSTQ